MNVVSPEFPTKVGGADEEGNKTKIIIFIES